MKWFYLFIAIIAELIGTSALKSSEGFKHLIPSVIVVVGYAVCFFFLSLSLKYIPLGIAYAIWGGAGIILIAAIGYFVFKQPIDIPAMIGIVLIVAGVVIINVFSKTVSH